MMPRQGRLAVRQTAQKPPQPKYQAYSFPGPSQGWVSDQNLAISQPGAAYILENIFPIATGGVLRRGKQKQADLTTAEVLTTLTGTVSVTEDDATVTGTDTEFESELEVGSVVKLGGVNYTVDSIASDTSLEFTAVAAATLADQALVLVTELADPALQTLFAYESGNTAELFAIADGGIFDVTALNTPVFHYAVTEGRCSTAQYTSTDGTRYVRGVNGTDTAWVYDGTDFGTSPALTFAAPDDAKTSDMLSYTWVHRDRFFFIEESSLTFWYLAVGNVGGELTRFDLGGEFELGGRLIFGASWSIESGAGLNQYCVFATDKGEVAVYAGSNPSDADDWQKVGVYFIGKPKGSRAFEFRGGDIVVATDVGLVPLSSALQKDPQAVALNALSSPIENEWRNASSDRGDEWAVKVWSAGQMVAVALPTSTDQTPTWLVANARTNKWTRFTGWDAACMAVHNDRLFFGSPDGYVFEANTTGSDDGETYTGIYVPVFDQMGVAGLKTVHMARAVIRSAPNTIETLSVHSDFTVDLPSAPDSTLVTSTDVWASGEWGASIWGSEVNRSVQQDWKNISGQGEAVTIAHQVTSGGSIPIDSEFIRTDVLFTAGEMQS